MDITQIMEKTIQEDINHNVIYNSKKLEKNQNVLQ